jgi:hypothetical protein
MSAASTIFLLPISAPHFPLVGLMLQELPMDVIGHRSPIDADERRRMPSPLPLTVVSPKW